MSAEQPYRLPGHARPLRYEITLEPDLELACFEGHVAVDLDVTGSERRLVLNSVDLEITSVSLVNGDGSTLRPEIHLDPAEQQLELRFDRVVTGPARLSIAFAGILNDQLRGFYRSTYRDESGTEKVIATTQFESTDARRAFPCWDEPEFKAVFSVTLAVDAGLTAISNGRLESSTDRPDGRIEMRFADTMVMSTYLVAVVVGPFEFSEVVEVDGTPIRVAALPGRLALCGYALEVAEHSLRFLADYFGIPYPADKLDHLAIPDFAQGAMENLGAVTYRENLLLTDPATSAQVELQRIASVIAHETAHMWFGNLVTMRWWNGIWLNEAFATFMELTTSHAFRPEWQVWKGFSTAKSMALGVDGLRATRPVEYPVGRPEEAEGMFDVLTYQKGGSVLKMLEQYLGAEVFRKGISHYLASHVYSNTETSDLWDALETISGEPVRTIMATWIEQGGYPVVRVSRGDDPSTVVLSQDRFLYDGSSGHVERWAVPVNLRASVGGAEVRERLLVDTDELRHSFSGPVDWLVVNEGAWGFYRVEYSDELWTSLLAAGATDVLEPAERPTVLGDTWASVVAGRTPLSRWAEAAIALDPGDDPDTWSSVIASLGALERAGDDADRTALSGFARRLAAPAWSRLGWEPQPGESDLAAIARSRVLRVLADQGGDTALADEARQRLWDHLGSAGRDGLAPDLVGAVAQIAVASGGHRAWEAVLDAYRSSLQPQERLRFLLALGETPDPELSRRTLELALGAEVRSQDAHYVIASALINRRTGPASWAWVVQEWEQIVGRLPVPLVVRVIEPVAGFADVELAGRVRSWVAERSAEGGSGFPVSPIRVAQILERMDVSVAMAGRLRGRIAAALG